MDFLSSADVVQMYFALGLAIGLIASLWVVRRCHYRCKYCGNRHRERPKNMNALVFMMTICRRIEEIQAFKERQWQPQ